jgi:uncharacterized protein YjbI with pentapeptide repeats
MTRLELISEIGKGRKAFRAQDFSDQDLSGLDLSGCDLRRSNFTNANLSNCNLSNAILVVANLLGANLSGATLDGCDFELVLNADTANFVDATYGGKAIKSAPTVDKVGKYQRLVTDQFIQIGCLKGDNTYWKTMDDAKLNAEIDKVNPSEKADAKAWKDAHLANTIKDHEDKKPKK